MQFNLFGSLLNVHTYFFFLYSIPLTVEWSAFSPHDLIVAGCHDGTVIFCISLLLSFYLCTSISFLVDTVV